MNKLELFVGEIKPNWNPTLKVTTTKMQIKRHDLNPPGRQKDEECFYYVVDDFLSLVNCNELIQQFLNQTCFPVGVDGYGNSQSPSDVGSYRTNAWSESLAHEMTLKTCQVLNSESSYKLIDQAFENNEGRKILMPLSKVNYHLLGVTPYFRFMKYLSGGRHIPHYDAPFRNEKYQYTTLMSWVLYLNSPEAKGGSLQFVDDQQWTLLPDSRNTSDWKRMASPQEILASVSPRMGRLLIFPHWYPHQVEDFIPTAADCRYVIRGDVAYGW